MSQVDYYILTQPNYPSCHRFACQLIEKAYQNGCALTVHHETLEAAHKLNQQLWTFRNESFIPHDLVADEPPQIVIPNNSLKTQTVLLNLRLDNDPITTAWSRILQVVPNDPHLLNRARTHYRYYQKLGHIMNTHKMS